jgi:lactose/L-arabinose transport system ATP-binding protein
MVETKIALPATGSKVVVGLRPRHLSVEIGPSDIVLDIRERLGGVSYDYLKTPQDERLIAESRNDEMIKEGTPVRVTFDPADVLFFDPKTERRLR